MYELLKALLVTFVLFAERRTCRYFVRRIWVYFLRLACWLIFKSRHNNNKNISGFFVALTVGQNLVPLRETSYIYCPLACTKSFEPCKFLVFEIYRRGMFIYYLDLLQRLIFEPVKKKEFCLVSHTSIVQIK